MPDSTARSTPAEGLRYWAAQTPGRVALQDDRSALTFAELQDRVERLGREARLAVDESASTTFLPVIVDRSVESCVAVLACLCGRVPFVPIDSSSSPEYAQNLFERVGSPDRVLAAPGLGERLVPPDMARVVVGETNTDRIPSCPADDEPAIVIFTSGSTGRPKGVVLDWAAMDDRWRYREATAPGDRTAYSTPLIPPLDSLWGVTLLSDVASGCSILVIDVARLRPDDLVRRLAEFGPSHVALPSQLARILSHLPAPEGVSLPSVTHLGIGSEGFRYEFVAGLNGLFPPEAVVTHSLASTEAWRVLAQSFRLDSAPATGLVHVGLPVIPGNVRFRPIPGMDDSVREVLASGPIAREYLNDPEMTELKFITDADGRRWWCSGDMVSMSAEGMYVHRGRMDDVVKVRGKLASPSEVTAALLRIPGIRSAIVVPDEQDYNMRLVAHVEVEEGSDLTLGDVRASLSQRLPVHLVPAAVMRHRRLPINRRGKVDRQALMNGPFEAW